MIINTTGVLIRLYKFKESGYIANFFTVDHGKLSGLVRSVDKKRGNALIPGNTFDITWKARLEEHLGTVKFDVVHSIASKMASAKNISIINYLTALLDYNFKEKSKEALVYNMVRKILQSLDESEDIDIIQMIFEFELLVLQRMGYGLNLQECALTGNDNRQDLHYLSPNTGAACTKAAGDPYKDRLLEIPRFFFTQRLCASEVQQVHQVIQHFLMKNNILPSHLYRDRDNITCIALI